MTYAHLPDPLGEIEIPTDGTLSRTVFEDDQVKVLVFAFDAGQELSEHTSASAAIIQVLSGKLALSLGGDPVEALPGSWVHMSPRLPHAVDAVEPSVMLLTLLRSQED